MRYYTPNKIAVNNQIMAHNKERTTHLRARNEPSISADSFTYSVPYTQWTVLHRALSLHVDYHHHHHHHNHHLHQKQRLGNKLNRKLIVYAYVLLLLLLMSPFYFFCIALSSCNVKWNDGANENKGNL